jgi:hypothetical protein
MPKNDVLIKENNALIYSFLKKFGIFTFSLIVFTISSFLLFAILGNNILNLKDAAIFSIKAFLFFHVYSFLYNYFFAQSSKEIIIMCDNILKRLEEEKDDSDS